MKRGGKNMFLWVKIPTMLQNDVPYSKLGVCGVNCIRVRHIIIFIIIIGLIQHQTCATFIDLVKHHSLHSAKKM